MTLPAVPVAELAKAVYEAREAGLTPSRELAKRYGVSLSTAYRYLHRVTDRPADRPPSRPRWRWVACRKCRRDWVLPIEGSELWGFFCVRCQFRLVVSRLDPPIHLHRAPSVDVGVVACWPGDRCPPSDVLR